MNPEQKDKSEIKYEGVGGWLSLFIISLIILNPLMMVFGLVSSYEYVSILFLITSVWTLGLMCFSIYAGILLWKIRPNAVKIAKICLFLYLVGPAITILLFYLSSSSQELMGEFGKELSRPAIYVLIWFSYLNISKRVKATYSAKPKWFHHSMVFAWLFGLFVNKGDLSPMKNCVKTQAL